MKQIQAASTTCQRSWNKYQQVLNPGYLDPMFLSDDKSTDSDAFPLNIIWQIKPMVLKRGEKGPFPM